MSSTDRPKDEDGKKTSESHQIFGLMDFSELQDTGSAGKDVPIGDILTEREIENISQLPTVPPHVGKRGRHHPISEMNTTAIGDPEEVTLNLKKGEVPPKTVSRPSKERKTLSSMPPPPLERTRVGRYEVIYPMAAGGMASVHLGRLSGLAGFERLVAIKIIHPHLSNQKIFVDMFLDEARLAAQIHHPNVGEILEVGKDDGLLYMVGELIEGRNLRKLFLRAQKKGIIISQALIADIMAKVCRGLHAAHELTGPDNEPMNLVHRDVSPRNIMISYTGDVKLIDFGVVHAQGRLSHTEAGLIKGKFGYVSPEQSQGEPLDRRSDVFSVGVTMYLLLTGSLPFEGKTGVHQIQKLQQGDFPLPSRLNPRVHPELERMILKAMQVDPAMRYQTAAEFAYDLEGFIADKGRGDHAAELSELMGFFFSGEQHDHKTLLRQYRRTMGEDSVRLNIKDIPKFETGKFKALSRTLIESNESPYNESTQEEVTAVTGIKRMNSEAAASKQDANPTRKLTYVMIGGLIFITLLLLGGLGVIGYTLGTVVQESSANGGKATKVSPQPLKRMKLALSVSETGYRVFIDNKHMGRGVSFMELAADGKSHSLGISKTGFISYSSVFIADGDKEIRVVLKPESGNPTEERSDKNPEEEANAAMPQQDEPKPKATKRNGRSGPTLQESPYQ